MILDFKESQIFKISQALYFQSLEILDLYKRLFRNPTPTPQMAMSQMLCGSVRAAYLNGAILSVTPVPSSSLRCNWRQPMQDTHCFVSHCICSSLVDAIESLGSYSERGLVIETHDPDFALFQ